MFDRILVPLDGSADSESILTWLRTWNLDTRLVLFHCVPSRLPKGEPLGTPRFETAERAQEYLESIARTLPVASEVVVRSGSPGDRIVTAALQAEARLVVLGSCGDFGVPRTLGKVNEIVARTCPRPVLVVKTPARPSRRRIRRILAPLDAASRGADNMDLLRGMARDLHAEVIFLHVGSSRAEHADSDGPSADGGSSYSDVQLHLIRQVWSFLKDGIAARTIMTKGSIVEETLTHEQSLDIDIVAIPKETQPGETSWQALVAKCERAVLLYEPQEAVSTLVSSAAQGATLTGPRSLAAQRIE
jgi:nucleotide-binding universal stress UspA family protein